MKKNKLDIKKYWFSLMLIAILLSGSFFVSGVFGLRTVFMLLVLTVPFYLIISLFKLTLAEKLIFALFLSLTYFSLVVYWVNHVFASYRLSLIISFILLLAVYPIVKIIKKGGKD